MSGTIYAQLFYAGEEQFFCNADSCVQTLGNGTGSSDWTCQDLKCHCITNATFCGGIPFTNLTSTLDGLSGQVEISCDAPSQGGTAACSFKQATIASVFGSNGLTLSGCTFGECVSQAVIDMTSSNTTSPDNGASHDPSLGGGVIAGLAVVGTLIGIALLVLIFGWFRQRQARRGNGGVWEAKSGGVGLAWTDVSYFVPPDRSASFLRRKNSSVDDAKAILDNVSGHLEPGQMMAIMGPSGELISLLRTMLCLFICYIGAGKTTLIEILAGKSKVGHVSGNVSFPAYGAASREARVGFVPQQDILPAALTVYEAILFAARLRLPESIPKSEQVARVDDIIEKLGLTRVRDVRIGDGERRGISGGEMRRVSIGLELVAKPDILILDEPTSGLDSVSAAKVARVLHSLAHDEENPTVVIASIHQPR